MHPSQSKHSTGAAVLIIMLTILMLASLLMLSAIKSVKTQTRVVQNQKYVDQAYQASEAGLEAGYAYLKENHQTILKDTYENKGAGDGYIDFILSSELNDVANDDTSYDVEITNPNNNDFSIIEITSKGSADSDNIGVNISEQIAHTLFSSITPPASLVTLGSVSLNGNASLLNTSNDINIISGCSVTLSGSASTQASANISSDRNELDTEVQKNNNDYSSFSNDEFFLKLFGANKSNVQSRADYVYHFDLSSLLSDNSYHDKSIWINETSGTASLIGNSTIGRAEKPVF